MTIQQMLLAGGASGPYAGLLDSYTTSIWGAYGLSRLRSSTVYAGSAIRVRRSSDDAEQDIGFSGTALDTSALTTFVGANNGYVVTWYDQSGNGNDITQATAASQPQIVDAGTYMSEVVFDGVNDALVSSAAGGSVSATTVHIAGRQRTYDAAEWRALYRWRGAHEFDAQRDTSLTNDYQSTLYYDGTGVINVSSKYERSPAADNTVYSAVFDKNLTPSNQCLLYINGALASGGAGDTTADADMGAYTLRVGADSSPTGTPSRLAATTIVAYETGQLSDTVDEIAQLVRPTIKTDGLTGFTTNLWGAYSLRRIVPVYAGSCIRVRRDSDNAEQDIGFTAAHIWDAASLLTFAGAGSAFVKTFYDQSGAGNDLTQTTTANQPRVVNSATGAVDEGLVFDGSDDYMATSANSGTPSAFTALLQASINSASSCVVLEQSASVGTNTGAMWTINGGVRANATSIVATETTSANMSYSSYDSMAVGNVAAARWDRSQGTSAAMTCLFSGGLKLTRAANADAGTLPSGNFVANAWNLGARATSILPTPMTLTGLVLYETAVSDADIERISRALG